MWDYNKLDLKLIKWLNVNKSGEIYSGNNIGNEQKRHPEQEGTEYFINSKVIIRYLIKHTKNKSEGIEDTTIDFMSELIRENEEVMNEIKQMKGDQIRNFY